MKSFKANRKHLLIYVVLFTIIGFIVSNNVLFVHTHILSDGTLISHAHPYKKANEQNTPVSSHQHTQFEYLVISHFSVFAPLLALAFLFINKIQTYKYSVCLVRYNESENRRQYYLRGPPVR